ncbi:MAG: FliI/YscN family ATPase [Candidatus Melainabacteria bacterium]|nr:FliI/YscN family ATPase [Candidatus Melainabacteria bacterium]
MNPDRLVGEPQAKTALPGEACWQAALETIGTAKTAAPLAQVVRVVGLTIEATGGQAKLGDLCRIETEDDYQPWMEAEVVGFRDGNLLLMPLGEMAALRPGSRVWNTGAPFRLTVGPELVGRVLNGLGQPIDDRYPVAGVAQYHLHAHAPHPLRRQEIHEPVSLGIRAIDGFLTVGKGQRIGIFAGSGVGKSTTLGMIARNTEADLSVIALIGERGREVRDFITQSLGEDGLRRSILVVATAEQSALLKIKAALVATTLAEYFRKEGQNVLLMMDSLTRVAMALREVGLAIGEPPATRGYTPTMYSFLPKLVERAGTSDTGAITGLYTVLVEGDDFNEPVADTVRGLLDGHIVLNRALADRNHFPAIDVSASISRLMMHIVSAEHKQAAGLLRDALATYQQSEDLISIGAYVPGHNARLDRAVALKPHIDQLLRQEVTENSDFESTVAHLVQLAAAANSR